jgi:hypothetical protein
MGYRSEVVLAVAEKVMPQFLATMAKSPETRRLCFQEHCDMVKDYYGKGNILFRWDSIKWYEGYEEVDALTNFMDWCDEGDENEIEYRFVRVGENYDDIVHRGQGFDEIYPAIEVRY